VASTRLPPSGAPSSGPRPSLTEEASLCGEQNEILFYWLICDDLFFILPDSGMPTTTEKSPSLTSRPSEDGPSPPPNSTREPLPSAGGDWLMLCDMFSFQCYYLSLSCVE
jgi:hypothetical protein